MLFEIMKSAMPDPIASGDYSSHCARVLTLAAPRREDPLQARAAILWPDSARNQAEWLRAVRAVRSTANGWLLERPAQRVGA